MVLTFRIFCDLDQLPSLISTGNTVDDIINAVASGLYKRSLKRKKEPIAMLNIMPLPRLPVKEIPMAPPPPAVNVEQRSDSKRGRGRRKRNVENLVWGRALKRTPIEQIGGDQAAEQQAL